MIKADRLNFSFDNQTIFFDASFSLNSQGVYVLQGENGSGKTTLLKLLLGYFLSQDGNIQIDGINLNKDSTKDDVMLVRDKVAYLSQDSDFISFLNAQENASIFNILNQGELDDLKLLDHEKFKNRKGNELSSGEKVLISFERLINENKKIILLDECTDFLDDKNTKTIISKVKELGKTKLVIIVSHDPRIIKCFKQYIRIENNQIISSFDDNISSEICENVKTKSTRKKLFYPSLRLIKNNKIYILLLTLLMLVFNVFYFGGSNYITYPKKDFFESTITSGSYLLSKEKEAHSIKINDLGIDISLEIQPHLTKEDHKIIVDQFNTQYYDSMYFNRIKIGKDDGYFHIPKDEYDKLTKSGRIKKGMYYYYSLFKIPCVKDKSISESYIYQDDIYKNIEYIDSLELSGALWENSLISYSSKEGLTKLLNEYGKISFVSPSIFEQKYQVSLNKEIKNNELYFSSFLQEYYTDQVLTFMDYSKVDLKQYYKTFYSLSDVFVSAHLVDDDYIQKYLKRNEVLISEECFRKIINKIDYKESPIIEVDEKNRKDFIDFNNKNNYSPYQRRFYYTEIRQSYSSFSYDYETYAMYYLIMLFLFIVCECSLIYIFISTYYEKQKNNILVFSRYLKLKETLILFLTPFILSIMISFVLGLGISIPILSNYYTSREYFIPNVPINIFEVLITFGFNLLVLGFTSLILLINIKKKKNK